MLVDQYVSRWGLNDIFGGLAPQPMPVSATGRDHKDIAD